MPLFDYQYSDCGAVTEILIASSDDQPQCRTCGGGNLKKMLSAHSSLSRTTRSGFPGQNDTACCGSNTGLAGCTGPGSCCGKLSTQGRLRVIFFSGLLGETIDIPLVNRTIDQFLGSKPVLFCGTPQPRRPILWAGIGSAIRPHKSQPSLEFPVARSDFFIDRKLFFY